MIKDKEEKERNGEDYVPEDKDWEDINAKDFSTDDVHFVVCLNTLGSDKEFTENEKLEALRTVQKFKERYENQERDKLKKDLNKRLEGQVKDKEFTEENVKVNEDEEKAGDEYLANKDEAVEEDMREVEIKRGKFEFYRNLLFNEENTRW